MFHRFNAAVRLFCFIASTLQCACFVSSLQRCGALVLQLLCLRHVAPSHDSQLPESRMACQSWVSSQMCHLACCDHHGRVLFHDLCRDLSRPFPPKGCLTPPDPRLGTLLCENFCNFQHLGRMQWTRRPLQVLVLCCCCLFYKLLVCLSISLELPMFVMFPSLSLD